MEQYLVQRVFVLRRRNKCTTISPERHLHGLIYQGPVHHNEIYAGRGKKNKTTFGAREEFTKLPTPRAWLLFINFGELLQ